MTKDSYQHIHKEGYALIKDKGSKFHAYAFEVNSVDQVHDRIASLRKEHPLARHFCWASIIGFPQAEERANDAGEPAHSAGTPILHALLSANLHNSAVVVVQLFGGTKLGIPGLISAYKGSASAGIAQAEIQEAYLMRQVHLTLTYEDIGALESLASQHQAQLKDASYGETCQMTLHYRASKQASIESSLQALHRIQCTFVA